MSIPTFAEDANLLFPMAPFSPMDVKGRIASEDSDAPSNNKACRPESVLAAQKYVACQRPDSEVVQASIQELEALLNGGSDVTYGKNAGDPNVLGFTAQMNDFDVARSESEDDNISTCSQGSVDTSTSARGFQSS